MNIRSRHTTISLSLFLAGAAWALNADATDVDFTRDIRPILTERCFLCHGPDVNQRKADLRLDVEKIAKKKVIVPGDPDASELIRRITSSDPDVHMPPPEARKPHLSPEEIALFREWIAAGAPWAKHWSFQPVKRPELPAVSDPQWVRNGIDAFVHTRLDAEGIQPSPEANRETLIRRLSFDLRGLPPTIEEIDRFLDDDSDDAYEKIVDRFLSSPAYGEHMAADWLDGARYADTNGFQNDFQRYMWPWRDWVIEAFNDNMSFDQFTIEQIAGDLLPNATDSQRIATGFNRNNRSNTEGGSIEAEWRVENIVDRIETTSTVFLGLTMGCARCHDHKYDPIDQKEFYNFFAFFNSTADRGFYEETRGNAGPVVSLPSFDNQRRMGEFDADIAKAQRVEEEVRAGQDGEIAAWLEKLRSGGERPAIPLADFTVPLRGELPAVVETLLGSSRARVAYGGPEPQWTEGLLGLSLVLEGTSEGHVDLGQTATFQRKQPFSISIWVKPDGPGALFSKMDEANAQRGVETLLTEKGALEVHIANASEKDAIKIVTDEKRLRTGTWSHVCVTYDGSSKAKGVRVYVNGTAATLRTEADSLKSTIDTGEPLRLGRNSSGNRLKGAISDFRIYSRALKEKDIQALMDAAIAPAAREDASEIRRTALTDHLILRYSYLIGEKSREIARIQSERAKYVADEVPTAMVMQELEEPRPTYRLIRGAYDAPDESEIIEAAVPAFLPPLPSGAPRNRLGLAEWLVSPKNPLFARVTVNRLWQKFFGQGIVKTVEDFGVQGSPPTHPRLLDWLATEFTATGWDLKEFQKRIVMSATYRQSSALNDDLLERDPENKLLARGPRYRLPAEVIRDNALAVSGLLSTKMAGPSVKPYQPENLWAELAGGAGQGPYVQSHGEDLYRRSLYIYRKRTVPPPSMTTFDAPSWEICRVRRTRTNTPLQALALLNEVTYVEAARNLAQRMLREGGTQKRDRLTYGFRLATGRRPAGNELRILEQGLEDYLAVYAGSPNEALLILTHGESKVKRNGKIATLAAYTAVGSVILNLDETITKE